MFRDWFFNTKRSTRINPISLTALEYWVMRILLEEFRGGRCVVFVGSVYRVPSDEELVEAFDANSPQSSSNTPPVLSDLYRSAGDGRGRLNARVARLAAERAEAIAEQRPRSIHDLIGRARAIKRLITTDYSPYLSLINLDEPFRQVYSDATLPRGGESDRIECQAVWLDRVCRIDRRSAGRLGNLDAQEPGAC